jgi:FMN reductase [NAD(P)H]
LIRTLEFHDLLNRRRMVRLYRSEAVDRGTLERIVATVRRAPSAGFSQGQRLLVVSEPELLRKLAEPEQTGEMPQGAEPWAGSAAAQVFVLTREADYHERYQKQDKLDEQGAEIAWPVPFWHFDAGAAAMLVLLAAIDEGLACGLYGVFGEQEERVRELLKIPPELTIVAGITIGRPAPDPGWSKLTSRATQRRRPLDELVHWQTWDERT